MSAPLIQQALSAYRHRHARACRYSFDRPLQFLRARQYSALLIDSFNRLFQAWTIFEIFVNDLGITKVAPPTSLSELLNDDVHEVRVLVCACEHCIGVIELRKVGCFQSGFICAIDLISVFLDPKELTQSAHYQRDKAAQGSPVLENACDNCDICYVLGEVAHTVLVCVLGQCDDTLESCRREAARSRL